MVVVEEDAHRHVEQNAYYYAHEQALQYLVLRYEEEVAEGTEGGHDSKDGEEDEAAPKAISVVQEQSNQYKGDGDVVKHNAVEKALVEVAVNVDHGHAFEEGMDGETYNKARDGVNGVVMAVSCVGMVFVMVFFGLFLLFAARTVIVTVLSTLSELL